MPTSRAFFDLAAPRDQTITFDRVQISPTSTRFHRILESASDELKVIAQCEEMDGKGVWRFALLVDGKFRPLFDSKSVPAVPYTFAALKTLDEVAQVFDPVSGRNYRMALFPATEFNQMMLHLSWGGRERGNIDFHDVTDTLGAPQITVVMRPAVERVLTHLLKDKEGALYGVMATSDNLKDVQLLIADERIPVVEVLPMADGAILYRTRRGNLFVACKDDRMSSYWRPIDELPDGTLTIPGTDISDGDVNLEILDPSTADIRYVNYQLALTVPTTTKSPTLA